MKAEISIYNPDTLGAPLGQYCHVTRVKATEFLFIAGSLAADKEGNIIYIYNAILPIEHIMSSIS